jgi:hypothetical protein
MVDGLIFPASTKICPVLIIRDKEDRVSFPVNRSANNLSALEGSAV